MNRTRNSFICFLLIILFCLTGCTKYLEFKPKLSYPELSNKIPLRAGLYLPTTFTEFTPPLYKVDFTVVYGKVGKALTEGTISMTKKSFKEVVILEEQDQAAINKVDVIITPKCEHISYYSFPAVVKLQWTITDMNDKILYMNSFEGSSNKYKGLGESISFTKFTFALEDQFNKAFDGITKTKWWEGIAPRQ
jgi:hypothetical protein